MTVLRTETKTPATLRPPVPPAGGESGREPVGPSPEIFMGIGVWALDLLNSVSLFN